MRALAAAALAAVALAALPAACSSDGPSGSTCPNLLPPNGCPSPAPGFSAEVGPIIQAHCVPCHAAAGIESNRPFETYDQVKAMSGGVLAQVHACKMPPADGGVPLTDDEKRSLEAWLVCDAPNN